MILLLCQLSYTATPFHANGVRVLVSREKLRKPFSIRLLPVGFHSVIYKCIRIVTFFTGRMDEGIHE
jgi:hypothetical protein